MNIDHSLDDCFNAPKRPTAKPYIPKRVFETIETKKPIITPNQEKLGEHKISSFITQKDIREKCRKIGLKHNKIEKFTPPSAEYLPVYIGTLLLVGMLMT